MATLPPKGTPTPEDIKASYGFVAKIANAVPEINDLLTKAVREQWTNERFIMSVADSNWYKGIGEFERTWMMKRLGDPAQAEVEYQAGGEEVKNLAATLGIESGLGTNPDTARLIWLKAKLRGLNEQATRSYIINEIINAVPTNDNLGGRYGEIVNEMYKTAFDYGYSSPDLNTQIIETAKYMMRTSGGSVSTEGWKTKMANFAATYYAPFADDIRGGRTVAEIAKPTVDRVAELLEQNPANLSYQDPVVKKALTGFNNEGRAYSLQEVENMVRQDSRWNETRNARESAAKLVNEIGQRFGFVGGQ